jgi:hypothetical protein
MSTDEIVRLAAVASAAMVIAPDHEPGEMRHVIPALMNHLTGVVADLRREVTIPVPNWLPSPGRTDIVVGEPSPYSAVIEVKVWEVGWCLWDPLKVASLVERGIAEEGYLVVVASEGKFAQRPGFGEMLDDHTEIVTRDLFTTYRSDWLELLRGGSGRPVKLPGTLRATLLGRRPLEHKAGWEIRAVKVSVPADAGWVEFVSEAWPEGHPRLAGDLD